VTIVVSIQARLGSTRLPGKVLLSLGEKRVLEWVIERSVNGCIDRAEVVVAVGDAPENEAIREFCKRKDQPHATGPESDLLRRHLSVARSDEYETLVRITADCPFVPPSEIERTLQQHLENDGRYTTNHTENMPIGTAVDVIDVDVLAELAQQGHSHPVKPLREDPGDWGTVRTDDEQWTQFSGAHTAVDTPEDYWTLIDAIEAVGTDPLAVTKWVHEEH